LVAHGGSPVVCLLGTNLRLIDSVRTRNPKPRMPARRDVLAFARRKGWLSLEADQMDPDSARLALADVAAAILAVDPEVKAAEAAAARARPPTPPPPREGPPVSFPRPKEPLCGIM
jgi:hypothetical protein